MNTEFILIKQLTMQVDSKILFDQLEINIAQGETVAIIGANGAGKTTLLKLIVGILQPTTGALSIAGMQYSDPDSDLQLRSLIGFASDTPPLYPNDTVISYLNFAANLKSVSKQQIQSRIRNCLDIFELGSVANAYIYTLSKGTQQRINLAQAVISDPRILVLDEPSNGLDSTQCENFSKYLTLLKSQGTTIIIASHQYTEVIKICDYMLRINNRAIQKILTPLNSEDIKHTNDQIYYQT